MGGLCGGVGKEEGRAGLAAGMRWGGSPSSSASSGELGTKSGVVNGAVRLRGSSSVPLLPLAPW